MHSSPPFLPLAGPTPASGLALDELILMTKPTTREPSQRQLRVGEQIRHALAAALARGDHLPDPQLAAMIITVTEVRMSPDLKVASVYVRPLGGGDGDGQTAVKMLAQAAFLLRKVVARDVRLKYVPQLRFLTDTSFDEAAKIDLLLAKAQSERVGWSDPNDVDDDGEEAVDGWEPSR